MAGNVAVSLVCATEQWIKTKLNIETSALG